mgnify:CR=1 FL=1
MVDINNSRPILATIHVEALRHNLMRVQLANAASGDARVWAVVKANAYGHGLMRLLPALVLHDRGGEKHRPEVEAILRGEANLGWD